MEPNETQSEALPTQTSSHVPSQPVEWPVMPTPTTTPTSTPPGDIPPTSTPTGIPTPTPMFSSTTPVGVSNGSSLNGPFPPELAGWNWGAFFLNWIWSIGNSTWIGLLMFLPIANFIMPFVLGAKGNEWAWQNRKFESVEQFKAVQRAWAIVGAILFAIGVGLFILGIVLTVIGSNSGTSIPLNSPYK